MPMISRKKNEGKFIRFIKFIIIYPNALLNPAKTFSSEKKNVSWRGVFLNVGLAGFIVYLLSFLYVSLLGITPFLHFYVQLLSTSSFTSILYVLYNLQYLFSSISSSYMVFFILGGLFFLIARTMSREGSFVEQCYLSSIFIPLFFVVINTISVLKLIEDIHVYISYLALSLFLFVFGGYYYLYHVMREVYQLNKPRAAVVTAVPYVISTVFLILVIGYVASTVLEGVDMEFDKIAFFLDSLPSTADHRISSWRVVEDEICKTGYSLKIPVNWERRYGFLIGKSDIVSGYRYGNGLGQTGNLLRVMNYEFNRSFDGYLNRSLNYESHTASDRHNLLEHFHLSNYRCTYSFHEDNRLDFMNCVDQLVELGRMEKFEGITVKNVSNVSFQCSSQEVCECNAYRISKVKDAYSGYRESLLLTDCCERDLMFLVVCEVAYKRDIERICDVEIESFKLIC